MKPLRVLSILIALVGPASAVEPRETPMLADQVGAGALPPVARRLPAEPLVVTLTGDREPGVHGGDLRMLMGRAQDTRQMVVYGYARLVGYDRALDLVPDLLREVSVREGRVFTLYLRPGHRWSDGHPFTAEDFRYYWEDVANDPDLSPSGPPQELRVGGEPPRFEVLDTHAVRFTWPEPHPRFLSLLAGATPLFIYRPAHYLKRFHARYADPEALADKVAAERRRNWVALHYGMSNIYKADNPDLPTLQPWRLVTPPPSNRFVFERNPFFHRIDTNGRQLPYIDRVIMTITDGKLVPAKVGAGESDLQARYLSFGNYTFLKQAEERNGYRIFLWRLSTGSQVALYPNLNVADPAWRAVLREADFRRALSLAIDRHEINQVVYFGLALETGNSALPESPLYSPDVAGMWTRFDVAEANRLLDGLGLTERDDRGIRRLPDGRPLEIVIESAGESTERVDVLELIGDSWARIGVKLYTKPSQRELLRNRVFSGQTMMSVWWGLDNALVSAEMCPLELAPTQQQHLQWPRWGQHAETRGEAGEPVDLPAASRLLELHEDWMRSRDGAERRRIWRDMLRLCADQVFTIGTVAGVLQPVVVNERLRNVPEAGIWGWDPGAHFGIYRPDTFWFAPAGRDDGETG